MARTRIRRLNRLQRRRLRNPLPQDQFTVEVAPDLIAQMKSRLQEAVSGLPSDANRAYRRWLAGAGKQAPYFLALQVYPAATSHPAVTMDLEKVVQKLLALEAGDPLAKAYPEWMADQTLRASIAALMDEIAQMRAAAAAQREAMAAEAQARVAEQTAAREERRTQAEANISAARREELLALLDLASGKLSQALREDDFTEDDLNFLAQNLGKVGQAQKKSWGDSTMKSVRAAINKARAQAEPTPSRRERPSREEEQLGSEEAQVSLAEALAEASAGFAGMSSDEDEDFDDEDEDFDPSGEEPGLDDPKVGVGSAGWDPQKMSATSVALGKRIRGSIQRGEAKEARLKDFDKYLLSYRRPQARDRNKDLNAPVLYSPPPDVLAKIEEIMGTKSYSNRIGMPQQFQDVLVYVLTTDHVVGRSRVIPAGSVEVYNKGTLVGTFGKSEYKTNLKQALLYAGTLVGADLRSGKFTASKGSRIRSRILMASQGSDGFRLIAPSLEEVLRATPVSIEIGLDQLYAEGTKGFGGDQAVSNPRRAPIRSIGRTRYVPTANGYRILNGRNSGRHYTVNDFGHACKLALILDHM